LSASAGLVSGIFPSIEREASRWLEQKKAAAPVFGNRGLFSFRPERRI
jgi:hypothetical protein